MVSVLDGHLMLLCRMHFPTTERRKPKEHWNENAALFDAAADAELLRGAAISVLASAIIDRCEYVCSVGYVLVRNTGHIRHYLTEDARKAAVYYRRDLMAS